MVDLDDSLNIKPELAHSWKISEDGLVYTFFLREDVFFHQSDVFIEPSSRNLTAADVVFSLHRLSDVNLASPGSWIMKPIKQIKAKDKYEVEITLKENFPALLGVLSMKFCSILPTEVGDNKIDFRENPIGTGPFTFKRWIPKEKLVFRKNPSYFEKDSLGNTLPYLDAVSITFLPDKQSEFLQFIQGNLDFMTGLDVSYKDDILLSDGSLRDKYSNSITMMKSPYLNTEYIGFYLNNSAKDIHDISLRKAINYGFDRRKMIKYLRNNIGSPAVNGFIPKGLPGFDFQKGFDYQPNKAKELLEKYIKKTGDPHPEIVISTNPSYVDLIEFLQAELQRIGISVKIDVLPASTLRQMRTAEKLESFRASWIADYPDAQNYFSLFYAKNKTPNGPNYTHFDSKVFDSIYELSLKTPSINKRKLLYHKLDSIIIDRAAIIPLFYDEAIRFKQSNVKNIGINAINLLDLKKVYKQ